MSAPYVLDTQTSPTPRKVEVEIVQEALDALQIEGVNAAQIAASNLGPVLVAIVKHMMRDGGYLT
jgi:hypothetical protein